MKNKIGMFLLAIVILVGILKYMGMFNPKSINAEGFLIDTPKGYHMQSAHRDFNEFDITCGYSMRCSKKISFLKDVKNGGTGITILYKSYFPTEVISISIIDWKKVKIEDMKKIFLEGEINRNIKSCIVSENINISGMVRYSAIYQNKTGLIGISILATDGGVGNEILNKICQ